jgi:hypothetical protein
MSADKLLLGSSSGEIARLPYARLCGYSAMPRSNSVDYPSTIRLLGSPDSRVRRTPTDSVDVVAANMPSCAVGVFVFAVS